MLLGEIIGQVSLVRKLPDVVIAPLCRTSDVVETVTGNNADRIAIDVVVLNGERDDILGLVVLVKILSVRVSSHVRGIKAEFDLVKSFRAQRVGKRERMLHITLGERICAVGNFLENILI